MAMEFTYKISDIKVYSTDSQTDIIKEATLHIIGTQGNQQYENFMPIELAEPSGSFKEFDTVDELQVIEWLKNSLGENHLNAMKEGMESSINDPFNPANVSRANPQEKELLS